MASEISGFDVAVPKTGNQNDRGNEKEDGPIFLKKIDRVGSLRWLPLDAYGFAF